MTLTFENLIDHNRRTSNALIVLTILFLAVTCGFFAAGYNASSFYLADMSEFYNKKKFLDSFQYGFLLGAVLAIIAAVISYYAGNFFLLTICDGHTTERHDDAILYNIVEEMAIAGGMPMPKIFVIQDESLNAFASGRNPKNAFIAITNGLRKKLKRPELQAVVAHEMAHIKNYDTRIMMLIAVFVGFLVLISDLYLRALLDKFKFKTFTKKRRLFAGGNILFTIFFTLLAICLAWLTPIIAKLLQLAVSREREYLADADAVKLCRNPKALISALEKISLDKEELFYDNRAMEHMYIVNPNFQQRFTNITKDSIWSTHPPITKRIARIRKLIT